MITYLHVHAINDATSRAVLQVGEVSFPCFIGRTGKTFLKREGDGKSPIGAWKIQRGFFRADRMQRLLGDHLQRPLGKTDGWCDDAASGLYNRHVKLPLHRSHETMWREDGAYDVVFPTDHNHRPRIRGVGSAIFLHLTRPGVECTAGCVAVSADDMRKILGRCGREIWLVIWPSQGRLRTLRRK
jgi:L,D-peptidoglycan transpeptidase YkuD (ErfK/YbiS/YcfS/YnhG family)